MMDDSELTARPRHHHHRHHAHDGKELTATRQSSSPSTIWSALALIFALQHLRSNLNTLPYLSRHLQHSSSSFSTSSIVHNCQQNQLTLPPMQAIPTLKRKQLFDYLCDDAIDFWLKNVLDIRERCIEKK